MKRRILLTSALLLLTTQAKSEVDKKLADCKTPITQLIRVNENLYRLQTPANQINFSYRIHPTGDGFQWRSIYGDTIELREDHIYVILRSGELYRFKRDGQSLDRFPTSESHPDCRIDSGAVTLSR